jgi:MFS superfamily sulfate permease-like transporter
MNEMKFTIDIVRKDAVAGTITGLMAIPLTVGICLMSEYPIQTGLATVIFACIISFITYLFKPGNHVGVPGVAAGLAPILAMCIHKFGIENMPFLIFITSLLQMLVWRNNLEGYILKAVPHFLIEGLLAGVGLKIAMKFLPYTYHIVNHHNPEFWSDERVSMVALSVTSFILFVYLYKKFKDKSPGVPYIAVIGASIWLSFYIDLPMLQVDKVPFIIAWPLPDLTSLTPILLFEIILYAAMLALIDVIEQVMSNAAIEKIDPLGRKSNSNNSLLVMWLGNMGASFFGGMTNLDGLAKSSTNRIAGAVTKLSVVFVALVLAIVLIFPVLLNYLPEFSLAVLMIFTGWKMIAGLYNVAHDGGEYAFGLALFCGLLVFQLGIFEGLLISLAIHSFIKYVIYRHSKMPTLQIFRKFIEVFSEKTHPHSTELMAVNVDPETGGLRYSSVSKNSSDKKNLNEFINDWADGLNNHNLLSVVGTYDANGLLWGTFAKDLRSGHFHIKRYFEHLFELDQVKVHFDSGEIRQYGDIYIKSGAYGFSYTTKGERKNIPARYSFVCKKEKTGWYILEHHSSVFPS